MTAEQVIASIGIAAGLTGLVWLAVECISLERIERPSPFDPGDWSDADPRTAELANDLFHNGTDTGNRE